MGTNYVIGSMSKFPDSSGSGDGTAPGGSGTGSGQQPTNPDPGGGMSGGGGTPGGGTPGGGTPGGGTPGGGTPGGGTPGGGTPGGGTPGGGTPGGGAGNQTGDGLTILGNSGSGHLIDLELGPAGQGGLPINILANSDGASDRAIDLNVLDIGTDAPSLLDGTLLSGVGGGGTGDVLSAPLGIVDGVLGGSLGNDGLNVLGSSDSGHLIDVELGPAGNGLPINILAGPDGASDSAVDLNVLDVGPNGPSLLDGTLLSGAGEGGTGDILSAPLGIVDGVLGGSLGNDGLNVLGSSDSGHLIDVELGPAGSGLPINVLAGPDGASDSAVDLNVLDVGPNGPSLLDTTLLSGVGSSDGQPAVSGLDSLVGNVFETLDVGSIVDGGAGDIISAPAGIVDDVLGLGGTDLLGGVLDHGLLQQCECAA